MNKDFAFVEILAILILLAALVAGVYYAYPMIKIKAQDTRVESDVRQIGTELESFSLNSATAGYIDGSCKPGASSCPQVSASWPPVNIYPNTGTKIGSLATDILNSEPNHLDQTYLKSSFLSWTVSAAVPSSLVKNGTQAYCFSSKGSMRVCTNYPATDYDSQCPDTGNLNGQTFTCQNVTQ
jgi:type II secretory pathway pseudopilin PulG